MEGTASRMKTHNKAKHCRFARTHDTAHTLERCYVPDENQ